MELPNAETDIAVGDTCPDAPLSSSAEDDSTKDEAGDAAEQPKDKRKIFKIIVIGDSNVGKTCLTYRFCSGKFPEKTEATIGVDFREKWVDVGGEFIKLQIWDTAGQERFRRSMVQHYYRNVHAVVYVYDISRIASFENLPQWLAECEEHGLDMSVPRILVGNKCDLQDCGSPCVATSVAQRFADSYGMPLFETSAKDSAQCDHVESIFLTLAHKLKNSKSMVIQASSDEPLSPSIVLSRADHGPPYSPPTTDYCLC